MTAAMQKALAIHAANSVAFLEAAAAVPPERWEAARAEGKWSPAEIAAHLVQSYEVVTAELCGGKGLSIRTKPWQQILFRLLFAWRILYFGKFPRGVKAPREVRPSAGLPKEEALLQFQSRSEAFDAAARAAAPGLKLSHTYFGRGSASDGVLLSARHIEHHRRQLPGCS